MMLQLLFAKNYIEEWRFKGAVCSSAQRCTLEFLLNDRRLIKTSFKAASFLSKDCTTTKNSHNRHTYLQGRIAIHAKHLVVRTEHELVSEDAIDTWMAAKVT